MVLAILWSIFIACVLAVATYLVARGYPLRSLAADPAGAGPRGLIPVSATLLTMPGQSQGQGTMGQAILKAKKPGVLLKDPQKGFVASLLTRVFRRNPFFMAYTRGFMRIFSGNTAAPGSLVPPGILITGLLCYSLMVFEGDSYLATFTLIIALLSASTISFWEAIALGNRSLNVERNQSTWPMLLATGIRPVQVMAGKMITSFYALSGEWTYTLPFWLIAVVCGQKPGLLALALVQPALIALGILTGLWMASQPRFLVLNISRIVTGTMIVLALWLIAYLSVPDFPGLIRVSLAVSAEYFNPYSMALLVGRFSEPALLMPVMYRMVSQALLFSSLLILLWISALKRLDRVMQGE